MEDSFSVKVDRVFGSLTSPSSPTPWSLSDEPIEKKQWRKNDTKIKPVKQQKDGHETDDLSEKLDNDLSESDLSQEIKGANHESDLIHEIRSCVGLDSTLDDEEEEDENDRFALGQDREEEHEYDESTPVPCRVPDQQRDPTRYTRYTLDSTDDMDEASNRKAYMDFFNLMNKDLSVTDLRDDSRDPPTFTKRNKHVHEQSEPSQGESSKGKGVSVCFAAQNIDEDYAMDED